MTKYKRKSIRRKPSPIVETYKYYSLEFKYNIVFAEDNLFDLKNLVNKLSEGIVNYKLPISKKSNTEEVELCVNKEGTYTLKNADTFPSSNFQYNEHLYFTIGKQQNYNEVISSEIDNYIEKTKKEIYTIISSKYKKRTYFDNGYIFYNEKDFMNIKHIDNMSVVYSYKVKEIDKNDFYLFSGITAKKLNKFK